MVNGSITDAGGGSVSSSLIIQLVYIHQSVNDSNYDWAACVLHKLSLMVEYLIEEVFRKGGLKKRRFLQLLHTAYNLKQQYVTKI